MFCDGARTNSYLDIFVRPMFAKTVLDILNELKVVRQSSRFIGLTPLYGCINLGKSRELLIHNLLTNYQVKLLTNNEFSRREL